jgi:hypothetical protein
LVLTDRSLPAEEFYIFVGAKLDPMLEPMLERETPVSQ